MYLWLDTFVCVQTEEEDDESLQGSVSAALAAVKVEKGAQPAEVPPATGSEAAPAAQAEGVAQAQPVPKPQVAQVPTSAAVEEVTVSEVGTAVSESAAEVPAAHESAPEGGPLETVAEAEESPILVQISDGAFAWPRDLENIPDIFAAPKKDDKASSWTTRRQAKRDQKALEEQQRVAAETGATEATEADAGSTQADTGLSAGEAIERAGMDIVVIPPAQPAALTENETLPEVELPRSTSEAELSETNVGLSVSSAVGEKMEKYDPNAPALTNVNFSVRRGELMMVVGQVGSGRS